MTTLRIVPPSDTTAAGPIWLHHTVASRALEAQALAAHPAYNTLMARAGLSVARWARALVPHARTIWVVVGPGHNGGDGLAAAAHLAQAGSRVLAFLWGRAQDLPRDAQTALTHARHAGVQLFEATAHLPNPAATANPPDVLIDALFGLGQSRAPDQRLLTWIGCLNTWRQSCPVLAIDVPTGLSSDDGTALGEQAVAAHATLSLLTLKPGLLTHQGRHFAGDIWFEGLSLTADPLPPAQDATARLTTSALAPAQQPARPHHSHKGSFGDVWVVGGAIGMEGAATLAASAALHAGAGRVLVVPLSGQRDLAARPELMWRSLAELLAPGVVERATVVCGCGGGSAIAATLPELLARAPRLVVDADALNAIGASPVIASALVARTTQHQLTILTPHPQEAAGLAQCSTQQIQGDRLGSAHRLAIHTSACVVLKGSGTVVAQVGALPWVNSSGNARLSTPGSGDVLAGWIAGLWAQAPDTPPAHLSDLAAAAVWLHGQAADGARGHGNVGSTPLLASHLPAAMAEALCQASTVRP